MNEPATSIAGALCIRADAKASMGIGHVMRCLALAQAWRDGGGSVVLICATDVEALMERLRTEGIAVHKLAAAPGSAGDAAETLRAAAAVKAGWLVLDGYHFPPVHGQALKAGGLRLLVLDDLGDRDLAHADVVLNQNAYANAGMYAATARGAKLLLGTDYLLLRREFQPWRRSLDVPASGPCESVVVMLGGGDAANQTGLVLQAFEQLRDRRLRIQVVAGAANPHLASLRSQVPALQAWHETSLAVNPPNVVQLMAAADLAITAAGGTCWEFAFLGVPMLAVVAADNQLQVADWLQRKELAHVFGPLTPSDVPALVTALRTLLGAKERLAGHARRAAALVDGQGAKRVAEVLAAMTADDRPAT